MTHHFNNSKRRHLDIVILSDIHLGAYGCHAKELLAYLKGVQPDTLILNGDFIDFGELKKQAMPPLHLEVINEIVEKSVQGTKVYYITGNHDDQLRRFSDLSLGNIHLRDKLVLHLNKQKYWIFHGDIFDSIIHISPLLAKLGSKGYGFLIRFNRMINSVRFKLGWDRMSFANRIKHKVSKAVKYIRDFENTAIRIALEKEFDFVICGHIHKPQIRVINRGEKSLTYMNAGDWVENLTALEYQFNKWSIYQYDEMDFNAINPRLHVKKVEKQQPEKRLITKQSELLQKVLLETTKKSI